MTENPYESDTEWREIWNEGYKQAIEDALHVMKYSHYDRRSVEALRKKVSE